MQVTVIYGQIYQANITENGVKRIFATSAGDLPDSAKKYVLTIKKQFPIIVRKLTDSILTIWQNPGGERNRRGNQAETEQYARRPSDPYLSHSMRRHNPAE